MPLWSVHQEADICKTPDAQLLPIRKNVCPRPGEFIGNISNARETEEPRSLNQSITFPNKNDNQASF